ncbi:MAG: hypothetical protein PHF46_03925 [Candidatus Gracilibacteria bacterium]|nr:hypothetical protein [Candidatus Gracilibacteria bacterium]
MSFTKVKLDPNISPEVPTADYTSTADSSNQEVVVDEGVKLDQNLNTDNINTATNSLSQESTSQKNEEKNIIADVKKNIQDVPVAIKDNVGAPMPTSEAILSETFETKTDSVIPEPQISDFNKLKDEIIELVKNPNPIVLYFKSEEINQKLSTFINSITKKIVSAFGSPRDSQDMILSIYYDSNYQKSWISNLKEFLLDSRYFDFRLFFKTSILVNKKNQIIAKTLLKIYRKYPQVDITNFLKKYSAGISYEKIFKIYNTLQINSMQGQIEDKYIDENEVWLFLEQVAYKNREKRDFMFEVFSFELPTDESSKKFFSEVYDMFKDVARSYLRDFTIVEKYMYNDLNLKTKNQIDIAIKNLSLNRANFYDDMKELIIPIAHSDERFFWSYIKTQIINNYYQSVYKLFYWNKEACKNRREWMMLKGDLILNDKNPFKKDISEILEFKKLILELNSNIVGPFLKPVIYSAVADQIKISEKDLGKGRYLITLVLSDNYEEYKIIYKFFKELEIFLSFDDEKFNFDKVKIFAADINIVVAFGFLLYFYSPIGVFTGYTILVLLFFYKVFFPFRYSLQWNFGVKTFATVLLIFSSFFWLINLDQTRQDIATVTKHVEKIGVYKTDKGIEYIAKKVQEADLSEMTASIMNIFKK